MNIEEIALKHSIYNGMNLVDFSEVALPIYRVTAVALVQEKIDLPTIEEFVLRAIHLGFNTVDEIYGLLGISKAVTKGTLSSLIQADLVYEYSNGSVKLSKEGSFAAGEYSKIRPKEKQIVFDYDGIVRNVRISLGDIYLSPKEVKDQGLIEIRAIPARRPNEDEIGLQDVSRSLSGFTSVEESEKTLLRIREIVRAVRLFYKAVMLIYKDKEGERYEAAFYIDGALSEGHGIAFIESCGLDRLGLLKDIQSNTKQDLIDQYPFYFFEKDKELVNDKNEGSEDLGRRRKILKLNHKETHNALNRPEYISRGMEKFGSKVKTLPVYEHPKILLNALTTAKENVVIISPWITRAVVNRSFVDVLERLLDKGVDVKIGFGISSHDIKDELAQSLLENLDKKYRNFTLKNLGDTHAKVLIKDKEFYVITSFNWLSFKGDSKKKFREEWGNYVEGSAVVNDFYSEICSRFQ